MNATTRRTTIAVLIIVAAIWSLFFATMNAFAAEDVPPAYDVKFDLREGDGVLRAGYRTRLMIDDYPVMMYRVYGISANELESLSTVEYEPAYTLDYPADAFWTITVTQHNVIWEDSMGYVNASVSNGFAVQNESYYVECNGALAEGTWLDGTYPLHNLTGAFEDASFATAKLTTDNDVTCTIEEPTVSSVVYVTLDKSAPTYTADEEYLARYGMQVTDDADGYLYGTLQNISPALVGSLLSVTDVYAPNRYVVYAPVTMN